ncbi:MAG TPA: protein-L-isoaspartate O-methyltransferase [Actinomycetaceae bacterium]|nr:protein-L-isoaspartate O-methyltransferase [Actinomycetaceae bacterium]
MDDRLAAAFSAVPRERFLPPEQRPHAHWDQPLRLSHGQTSSQPTTVANMLELLDVRPGQRILDVGAGSGWTTALLAHLVGEEGRVFGVERIAELRDQAAAAVEDWHWADVLLATPGVIGLPALAPFDRILVSAEARSMPESLVEQLESGGVMVIPVRGVMMRVVRGDGDGEDTVTRHGWYSFVPLIED